MANEITYTGSGGNTRAAEVYNQLIHENLADSTDLRAVCAKLGDLGGAGSSTLTTGTATFADAMAAANTDEVTAFTTDNSALTSGSVSLAVAHQFISYTMSDLHMITGGPGQIDLARMAKAAADAYVLRFTDMVATTIATITANVGTSTVDMTVDDFYSALITLEQAICPGPFYAVLHPVQWTDLQSSIRSEGGAVQFMPQTAEALQLKGPGYKGSWLGCEIYQSDSITASGGNVIGGMFDSRCIAYVEASARSAMPGSVAAAAPAGSPVYSEFVRSGDPGESRVIAHAFVGVGLLEDARGCKITTDQ